MSDDIEKLRTELAKCKARCTAMDRMAREAGGDENTFDVLISKCRKVDDLRAENTQMKMARTEELAVLRTEIDELRKGIIAAADRIERGVGVDGVHLALRALAGKP